MQDRTGPLDSGSDREKKEKGVPVFEALFVSLHNKCTVGTNNFLRAVDIPHHTNVAEEAVNSEGNGCTQEEILPWLSYRGLRDVPTTFPCCTKIWTISSRLHEKKGSWLLMMGLLVEVVLYTIKRWLFYGWRMLSRISPLREDQLLTLVQVYLLQRRPACCNWGTAVLFGTKLTLSGSENSYLRLWRCWRKKSSTSSWTLSEIVICTLHPKCWYLLLMVYSLEEIKCYEVVHTGCVLHSLSCPNYVLPLQHLQRPFFCMI